MDVKSTLASLVMGAGYLLLATTNVSAEEAKFELKPNATMREVLADRTGKRTVLRLKNGEDIDGTVTLVGNGLVHITRLAGKDFYDAVVDISAVNAVLFQARTR